MNSDVAIRIIEWGALLAVLAWIMQRRRWHFRVRLSLIAIIGVFFTVAILIMNMGSGPTTLGPETAWYSRSPAREILLFALMLCGMTARYFTRAIEARRAKIEELSKSSPSAPKPALEFDAWEFAYPLFASVVTFGALLSQINDDALSIASLTLSFQTGFFWQTVLAVKEKGS